MASSAAFDSFINLLDRHLEHQTSTDRGSAGPTSISNANLGDDGAAGDHSDPSSRLKALRRLASADYGSAVGPSSTVASAVAALTPLERALLHEVQHRRQRLEDRQRDVAFWESYYRAKRAPGLDSLDKHRDLDDEQLNEAIQKRKQRLHELQKADLLRRQLAASIDNGLAIVSTLANTTPKAAQNGSADRQGAQASQDASDPAQPTPRDPPYLTTRQLLDDRDDRALEFLRVLEELNQVRDQRLRIKAEIRKTREQTSSLLASIKSTRSELMLRRIETQSQPRSGPVATQSSGSSDDPGMAARIQRAQAALIETKAKKEMVKGVLRGLILESGRDWTRSKATRQLMLSLEDEEEDSEDDFVEEEELEEAAPDDEEDGEEAEEDDDDEGEEGD
ncbi:hypothetical protein ACQY0O_006893 [Thecaphora frezii]